MQVVEEWIKIKQEASNTEVPESVARDVIRLINETRNNEKIINPSVEKADQLFDYGYAKTGYNHQGASEQFVISLEGAEKGRKFLATMRSFYVSTSTLFL